MFNEVSGDLKVVINSVGKIAQAMEHEAAIQEKAMSEDPMQKLREQAVNEIWRLEFTSSEVIEAALMCCEDVRSNENVVCSSRAAQEGVYCQRAPR
jgi:hypothetical protein